MFSPKTRALCSVSYTHLDVYKRQLEADVPVSEMHDFTTYLRQLTQGRGSFVFEFTRYEPLPSNLEPKVIEEAKKFIDMKDDEE